MSVHANTPRCSPSGSRCARSGENAVIAGGAAGIPATAVGVGSGLLLVKYIVTVTTPRVAPDLGATSSVSRGAIAPAALLGVVATFLALLVTARKLSRTDVPSTLRVVE